MKDYRKAFTKALTVARQDVELDKIVKMAEAVDWRYCMGDCSRPIDERMLEDTLDNLEAMLEEHYGQEPPVDDGYYCISNGYTGGWSYTIEVSTEISTPPNWIRISLNWGVSSFTDGGIAFK